MTSANLETSVHCPIVLQEGVRYYVTVQATNGAGLKEKAYSDGVTLDTSRPVVGDIVFEAKASAANIPGGFNNAMQNDAQQLRFSLTKADDAESEITQLMWCAGSSPGKADLVSWIQTDPEKLSISHFLSNQLTSGSSVFVTMEATNGAGMTSHTTSGALLIDSTGPSEGNVIVGNTPEVKYFKTGESLKADWSGFVDVETGLSHYEWAVCQSSSKDSCITPYVDIGQKTSIANGALDLKPGVCYVLVVRAYNQVGLFTEVVSNPFILDNRAPLPGSVFDGDQTGRDISIQSSTSTVSANWQPFSDSYGRILGYELCVGSEPEICDISGFIPVGMKLAGTITGLHLNHTGQYFVTVQANNGVGYLATSTSDGVQIDSTPPVVKAVRDGQTLDDIDLQSHDNFISANWDEFEDTESGVIKYEWCVGTRQGTCDVIPQTDVGDSTTVGQQVSPSLTTGMVFFVTLTVYNGAGGVTKVFTDGVKVDNTAPTLSKVTMCLLF